MKKKDRKKSIAGCIGGSTTSRAKRLAAKRNGAKGGRPKKLSGKIPTEKARKAA